MDYTKHKRKITELFSTSPVTRIRIKKNELVLRYSKNCDDSRQDEIFDTVIALENLVDRDSPTIRIKILDTDDLNTIQFEIGNTEAQTKIIKQRGIDF